MLNISRQPKIAKNIQEISLTLKIEAKNQPTGRKTIWKHKKQWREKKTAEQNMPQIMTILGELREGAVFREQMPKNDWPKEQNKKRN